MPTVHTEHGFRFVIYLNDHPPAHVHVFLGEGHAKVILAEDNHTLDEAYGFNRAQLHRILEIAARQTEKLLSEWERIHG